MSVVLLGLPVLYEMGSLLIYGGGLLAPQAGLSARENVPPAGTAARENVPPAGTAARENVPPAGH